MFVLSTNQFTNYPGETTTEKILSDSLLEILMKKGVPEVIVPGLNASETNTRQITHNLQFKFSQVKFA